MPRRFQLWAAVFGAALLLNFACGGSGGSSSDVDASSDTSATDGDAQTGDTEDDTQQADVPPAGNAGLTFTALLGDNFKMQFDPAARPLIPEDTSMDRGDLIIMLCATDDTTCEDPQVRVVDKTNPEEWPEDIGGPAPIQESFGPQITVTDLPAGDYNLMIVYDSLDSQKRGFGYDDDFDTDETAWGGIVSATDLMMSDEEPAEMYNPPPVTMPVTLTGDDVLDIGEITLSHYHEQKISDPPAADTGMLLVGNKTDNSLRLIDLSTYTVQEATSNIYDFPLRTSDGQAIQGTMCNVIPGPGTTVYAIFTASGLGLAEAGFIAQWDTSTREQVGGLVSFPKGASNAGPCRAVYHQSQGKDLIFAVAADSSNQGGKKGFWWADVTELGAGDVSANLLDGNDDELFDEPLMSVAAWGDEVYIGTTTTRLTECNGRSCAFIADIRGTGQPTLRVDGAGEREAYIGGPLRADVSIAELGNQTISCQDVEQGVEFFSLGVFNFKKSGEDLLFMGNCHEINMFELSTGEPLDFDDFNPGVQGFNNALFGGGVYDMVLSPDGDTVWAVTGNKSRIMHSVISHEPIGELGDMRITVDRHALLPIDISADVPGDLPVVNADYTTTNRDDFDGVPPDGINDLMTPAEDPGIDIRAMFLKAYYVFWNRSLSGSLPNPFPVGPTIAVANNTVWLRGAGADLGDEGPSGLGQNGNLGVFDLDAQRAVLWPPEEMEFYPPFLGLKQMLFGFDLTPARDITVATAGILYIP